MDGAASPSGLNVTAWKRMYTSFKSASADLCDSVASIARRLCSEYVDPSNISSLVAFYKPLTRFVEVKTASPNLYKPPTRFVEIKTASLK